MLTRTIATVLVFFTLASAAAACGGVNVEGDYNYVNENCTVVHRDAGAALIDGLFGALAAHESRYSHQPQLVWVAGYCPTYGGYVPCGQWVWR